MMTAKRRAAAKGPDESTAADVQASSVVTRMTVAASAARVWEGLIFYEELAAPPPLHLRLLLPVPIRTEGRIAEIGDQVRCLYEGGHLLKRLTRIEKGALYEFEVAEQDVALGGGMRLCGGCYRLRERHDNQTELAIETRYVSSQWPRWFWEPLEHLVCRSFHRYLLGSMRRDIESQ